MPTFGDNSKEILDTVQRIDGKIDEMQKDSSISKIENIGTFAMGSSLAIIAMTSLNDGIAYKLYYSLLSLGFMIFGVFLLFKAEKIYERVRKKSNKQ